MNVDCPETIGFFESREFLQISSHSFSLFVLPINCWGLYCIWKKTPKAMKLKAHLLNLHIWTTIFDLMCGSLITPFFFFPVLAGSPSGLLTLIGIPTLVQICVTFCCFGECKSSHSPVGATRSATSHIFEFGRSLMIRRLPVRLLFSCLIFHFLSISFSVFFTFFSFSTHTLHILRSSHLSFQSLDNMLEIVKNVFQFFALLASIVLNTVLTYLILTKSNSKMGSYKYIMMYFSTSALLYSVLSVLVRPDILSYSSCFVVFVYNPRSLFRPHVVIYLLSCMCGFYFFFASLIAVHFVYRYNALKNGSKWIYFRGKFSVFWFLISPLLYVNWTMNCLLAFQPNQKSSAFLRTRIREDFEIDIEDVTYIIADFYQTDDLGRRVPNMSTFISGINFLIMTLFSLSVIFVYAFKCYFEMTRVIAPGRNCSLTYKLLHTQLFRALIYQTLIPLVLMYIPLFILFVFPMLNVHMGFAQYVSISISIYPALDALPTLIFVRDYRDSLFNCLRKNEEVRSFEPYYVRRASTTFSTPRKSTIHMSRVDLG